MALSKTVRLLSKAEIFGVGVFSGRLIFIHLECCEVLPFCRFQRQRCMKIRALRAQDFYTPLALKTAKGQHLPALEVYKNQSPRKTLFPKKPALKKEKTINKIKTGT